MKRLLAIWALSAAVAPGQILFPAIPVIDYTAITHLIEQYVRMGLHLKEAIQQTKDMVRNTRNGPVIYSQIAAELNQLAVMSQYGQGIGYSLGNLDAVFRQRYPGYAQPQAGTWQERYQIWNQTALDSMSGTLRVAGLSNTYIRNVQGIIQTIRVALSDADGRMLALQAIGQMADQQNASMLSLRALMLADLQSKNAYQGMVLQKDAASEAAAAQFFAFRDQTLDQTGF